MVKLLAIGLAAVVSLSGGGARPSLQSGSGKPAPTGFRNGVLWVDGGPGECARGMSGALYDATKACGTFDAAYRAAVCGDSVLVRAGTYAIQTITPTSQHAGCKTPIAIRSETGAEAHLEGLAIRAPWVAVSSVDVGTGPVIVTGWDSTLGCYPKPTTNVSIRNSVFGTLTVDNVQWLAVERNSIGNVVTDESEIHDGTVPTCPGNNHLVLRGNTWHDYYNPTGGEAHMECLQLENVENVLLEGNRFQNCGQYDVFVSNGSPPGPVRNLTIRNNYFDAPCSNQLGTACAALSALSVGPTTPERSVWIGVTVMFNSFVSYPLLRAEPAAVMKRDVVAYNVTAGYPDGVHCGDGRWVMTKNMNGGRYTSCGTDFAGRAAFVNPSAPAYNLDLAQGSPGMNALRCPPDAPATDIRGTRRPLGSTARCDVGAFELPATTTKRSSSHR